MCDEFNISGYNFLRKLGISLNEVPANNSILKVQAHNIIAHIYLLEIMKIIQINCNSV